jgi:hypothetical protein
MWILGCPPVVGATAGPSAGRSEGRREYAFEPRSAAASGARGEYDFVDTVLLGISNLCVLWL